MNISTKSLFILIFLCIFAAEINNKHDLNMNYNNKNEYG